MTEIWKDITQLNGEYQVSNFGRIKRAKECSGNNGNQNTFVGKIIKPVMDQKGYSRFRLKRRKLYFRIHRLVAEAFIPNPDNKSEVNHINGIRSDNRVENLEWCTTEENVSWKDVLVIRNFLLGLSSDKTYSVSELLMLLPATSGGSTAPLGSTPTL